VQVGGGERGFVIVDGMDVDIIVRPGDFNTALQ
jgi:hypothetical protein